MLHFGLVRRSEGARGRVEPSQAFRDLTVRVLSDVRSPLDRPIRYPHRPIRRPSAPSAAADPARRGNQIEIDAKPAEWSSARTRVDATATTRWRTRTSNRAATRAGFREICRDDLGLADAEIEKLLAAGTLEVSR
jgi:hypothetical protein